MSSIPLLPSVTGQLPTFDPTPTGFGFQTSFNIAFNACNARSIQVFVTRAKGPPQASSAPWPQVEPPPAGAPAPPAPPPAPINPPPTAGGQKGGQIWRLIDPLAKVEMIPVWKDWSEEKEFPNGHWKPIYRKTPDQKIPGRKPTPPPVIVPQKFAIADTSERSTFKFDEPGRNITALTRYPEAFNDLDDAKSDLDRVADALTAPAQRTDGTSVDIDQTPFERKLVVFGHADMCAPFWYNFSLSQRRNLAVGQVMAQRPRADVLMGHLLNTGPGQGYIPCADFNPTSGPGDSVDTGNDEMRAERSPDGFAPAHTPGNFKNRRIELYVIPDCRQPSPCGKSKLRDVIDQIRTEIKAECGFEWPASQLFPCPAGKKTSTAGDDIATLSPCHALSSQPRANGHRGPDGSTGTDYRHCRFYAKFREKFGFAPAPPDSNVEEVSTMQVSSSDCDCGGGGGGGDPGTEDRIIPGQQVFDHWQWVDDPPVKVKYGEYHPPRGEHFSYYMDDMVNEGVDAHPIPPDVVAVAPNNRTILEDFNLIKAGEIRVVKMDVGFWGDERIADTNPSPRSTLTRRVPRRAFGLIEGQFVFNCYFETPETRGFVRPCSTGFDSNVTPLCAQFDQAVQAAGFRILIMATAVADGGPPPGTLKIILPDMHLPRAFEPQDPPPPSPIACVRTMELVKSMVLHQLKRDYHLPAAMTPWLTTIDRRLCRQFFENNGQRLKLPHIYAASSPTSKDALDGNVGAGNVLGGGTIPYNRPSWYDDRTSSSDGFLAQAADFARNAYNFLMQVGYRAFVFTRNDLLRLNRRNLQNFPEKGYGTIRDVMTNAFYGFTNDRNTQPAQENPLVSMGLSVVPELVQKTLDTHAGTNLETPAGRPQQDTFNAPGAQPLQQVEAGPARDLLRFLNVIATAKAGTPATATAAAVPPMSIHVIQTGDLFDLESNRRFLFEDFQETDDPTGQIPDLMKALTSPTKSEPTFGEGVASVVDAAGDALKFLAANFAKLVLGGLNATDHDLWWRRETNKRGANAQQDPEQYQLPPEDAFTITSLPNKIQTPTVSISTANPTPTTTGPFQITGLQYTELRAGTPTTVPMPDGTTAPALNPFPATGERGKAYLASQAQQNMAQVQAFVAPHRGNTEDLSLLAGNTANGNMGRWNAAIIAALKKVGATLIYGNSDCYRGLPRDGGIGDAQPYYSEPGLWVEHGHRFDDMNLDGQPFGSALSNLAYEISELSTGEEMLDEYTTHREQSYFQPGLIQWFLLVQFAQGDFIKRHQRPKALGQTLPLENVPGLNPFRIVVNSHTHVPDLVVAQIIFKDREVAEVDLPILGPTKVADIFNVGASILKGCLLLKRFTDWWNRWDSRNGFEKWWEDIQGNTINWAADFAGLGACADQAINFIKSTL